MLRRALIFVCLTLAAPAWGSTRFVSGLEDVPLMDGLDELPGTQTRFDSPYGRFFEIEAAGHGNVMSVARFYEQCLRALGWSRQHGKLAFVRGPERLIITTSGNAGRINVLFTVKPRD